MKELIAIPLLVLSIYGTGSYAAKEIHDAIRKEALTKVSQGLPSLTGLTRALRGHKK